MKFPEDYNDALRYSCEEREALEKQYHYDDIQDLLEVFDFIDDIEKVKLREEIQNKFSEELFVDEIF